MKKTACFWLLLCSLCAAGGEAPKLTEGVWHIASPGPNGEIRPDGAAYRFNPDGSVEVILSEKVRQTLEKARRQYRERTGEEMPKHPMPKLRWERKNDRLLLHMPSRSRIEVFIIGEDPDVLMPQDKAQFLLLARAGAKLSPERAKKFWAVVQEARRDKFADNLKLPENVPLAEPENERFFRHFGADSHWREAPAESFQHIVLSAIGKGPKLADDARPRIPSLEKLLSAPETKALVLRYLACHAEWRMYLTPDGKLHASRCFRYPGGEISPHVYSHYFLPTGPDGQKSGDPTKEFQFCFDIGLDGTGRGMQRLGATGHRGNNWHTTFGCGGALVLITDQSLFPGRQMTAAALDLAEKEFARLAANPGEWRKLLPPDSCRRGAPALTLRNGMQGGIYEAVVYCNPGEKGTIYLKAYEITKGTPLSAKQLAMSSSSVSGWSEDKGEQFRTPMELTIYEGNWGQFYGARFEVWFKPDSGGAERKLLEKNYKIQGWER